MSKVTGDMLRDAVDKIMEGSVENKRKFLETVELQIGLKNYDTQRDKRFSGQVNVSTVNPSHVLCC